MHLLDALSRYETQLQADGRSEHTVNQARRHVRLLAAWLDHAGHDADLAAIDHETLACFLADPGTRTLPDGTPKKATSLNALRSSLRAFFGYLDAVGHVPRNPARLVRRARCGTPPPRALTEAEQGRFLAVLATAQGGAGRRDRALVALLLGAGLRIGEALATDVEDLDLEAGELWLRRTKGDRPARVELAPDVREALAAWVGERRQGPLFPSRDGGRLTVRQAGRRLQEAFQRAGVRRGASPHSLRHSFAAALYQRTRDIFRVQRALRHRSVLSTVVYAGGAVP